jgi:formamidopyrimidine-DNA glycosylase
MPELPEVETVRRGLAPVLEGQRLERVEQRRPDLRFAFPEGFVQRLTGARIEALNRRAKYLLASLDRDITLVMHLGMSGRFEIAMPQMPPQRPGEFVYAPPSDPRHAHVVFETQEGGRVTYSDPRRFGFMDLIETAKLDSHPWFSQMGPEPLGLEFGPARLIERFKDRKQTAKTLLLDQRVVAGLGNIYVCEALHRAKISPLVAAGTIAPGRLGLLASTIKTVLVQAIEAGGSTLRDYSAADGALGYFQHSFGAYGQEGQPCPTKGCSGTIVRTNQSGRSTFYCPSCQV